MPIFVLSFAFSTTCYRGEPLAAAMSIEPLPRLDENQPLRRLILPLCRLKPGEIWHDPARGHRVGVLDAQDLEATERLFGDDRAALAIEDPPYNIRVGASRTSALPSFTLDRYLQFTRRWIANLLAHLATDSHFYLWMGAEAARGFQPLPDVMILLREFRELAARNLITMRNQRGYGTQASWMWVRQELLHYVKGDPDFRVVYTEIPKILRGYYKRVNGRITENLERGKSPTIRPGNVWVDVQQVFYRMEENVPGAYAQKPLRAIERIVESSSKPEEIVTDFFAHSGTTLIAAEKLGRRCYTSDVDPIFAELTIRRLERFRRCGKSGWQTENPFPEIGPSRGE